MIMSPIHQGLLVYRLWWENRSFLQRVVLKNKKSLFSFYGEQCCCAPFRLVSGMLFWFMWKNALYPLAQVPSNLHWACYKRSYSIYKFFSCAHIVHFFASKLPERSMWPHICFMSDQPTIHCCWVSPVTSKTKLWVSSFHFLWAVICCGLTKENNYFLLIAGPNAFHHSDLGSILRVFRRNDIGMLRDEPDKHQIGLNWAHWIYFMALQSWIECGPNSFQVYAVETTHVRPKQNGHRHPRIIRTLHNSNKNPKNVFCLHCAKIDPPA